MDPSRLHAGLEGRAELTVGPEQTALAVGSGRIAVLATPVMIGLIEAAAVDAVEALLPEGHQSVGTRLDVAHIAATPVGMKASATARLIGIDGRKLVFRVEARDEKELIGEGTHERAVVDAARFEKRVAEKIGR